jgi:hypothetical protein
MKLPGSLAMGPVAGAVDDHGTRSGAASLSAGDVGIFEPTKVVATGNNERWHRQ